MEQGITCEENPAKDISTSRNTGGDVFFVSHCKKTRKKVAFISPTKKFDFFVYIEAKIKQVAEQNGTTVDAFDSDGDAVKQADLMTQCVIQKYDAIIVAPNDTQALTQSILEANDAGIPIINYDSFMDADVASRVGTSNFDLGKAAGEWTVEYFKSEKGDAKGTIIVATYPALETFAQWVQGFEDVIAQYPDITIKEETLAKPNAKKAQELFENIMIANPD